MDTSRIETNALRLGDPYLLRAKKVDGELAVMSAGFVGVNPNEGLLNFDTGEERSGQIPIRAGRNSVMILDVQKGKLSVPSGLVVPKFLGLPAIGITLWRPLFSPSSVFVG